MAIAALLLVLAMTSGCGGHQPRQIRGELPTIDLDSLTRLNSSIQVDIGIRNINDSPLDVTSIRIVLTVNEHASLELADEQLRLTIGARGREMIRLTGQDNTSLQEHLEMLASGERASLPWSMTVDLGRGDRRDRQTEASGFLHSVPGQPDRFR